MQNGVHDYFAVVSPGTKNKKQNIFFYIIKTRDVRSHFEKYAFLLKSLGEREKEI